MRTSTERFVSALQAYLEKAITERVVDINEKDGDIQLPDIALWQSGYNGVLSGLSQYPGCIILVNGKQLTDPYTTTYSVVIGIGLTADDPGYLERMGRYYEDILEDAIRSDWTLGGAALDTDIGVKFESDCVNNVYLIQAELECQVDLGGYVYADEENSGAEDGGSVVQMSEVPGSEGAVSGSEGDGVLPALRDADDAGVGGRGEEDAPVQLGDKEE